MKSFFIKKQKLIIFLQNIHTKYTRSYTYLADKFIIKEQSLPVQGYVVITKVCHSLSPCVCVAV